MLVATPQSTFLVFLCLLGGAFAGRYSGQQTAQSQGDDPNASGQLHFIFASQERIASITVNADLPDRNELS